MVLNHCERAWVNSSGAIHLAEDMSTKIQEKVQSLMIPVNGFKHY